MALTHHEKKEINAKIVYYGPGSSGKTTNLKFLYEKMKPEYRGTMKFLNTKSGKMLFFDFMRPDQIGVQGYDVRFHIYTVPGEIADFAIWKTVLKGVDGLVFIADSEPRRLPDNLLSMEKLTEYLATLGKEIKDVPCLIQCNKQDVPGAATLEEIRELLRATELHMVPASAQKGEGVLNTLSNVVKMVLQALREEAAPPAEEEVFAPGVEEPAVSLNYGATGEISAEEVSPVEEEIISETFPEQESIYLGADVSLESEQPESTVESFVPEEITPEIFLEGESEQVGPGHLRLPMTVRYGKETKKIAIDLKLSIDVNP